MSARALAAVTPADLTTIADDTAWAIAVALRDGFDRHYALFRDRARAAKRHFEAGNWRAIRHVARDRIDYYDRRVLETVDRIEREFRSAGLDGSGADALWERVKVHYIGLLIDHRQPECAETFFNSVSCKILHRTYFHNRFIFVRPAVSTEHIDADPPTYRSYYPREHGLRNALVDIVLDCRLETRFADFRRDLRNVLRAFRRQTPRPLKLEANHQVQVLSSLFYRDFLHHLAHSRDRFIIAPGIKGLVMSVFTLPSYPYVFKVIKDRIATSKDTDAAKVKQKYALVKHHDRAGRMTDILEYSDVAFPRERFALRDYGDAIRELAAVNIFPGDLLFKNFGMTRYGRVVFYDYDEIEYLTDCRFRRIPPQPPGFDEMSGDVWYPVGPLDVFPEEFATFLLTDARVREAFMASHGDLVAAEWWQRQQEELRRGDVAEVLSYPARARFAPPVAAG